MACSFIFILFCIKGKLCISGLYKKYNIVCSFAFLHTMSLLKGVHSKRKAYAPQGRKCFLSITDLLRRELMKLHPLKVYPFSLTGKPEMRPYTEAEMQITKCTYQDVNHYVTSILMELSNNEPNLSTDNPMMSQLLKTTLLTLVLLNPDIPCLCKQCRSRSTDLDLHCLPFSMWIYVNNLDQVIWLAEN